VLATLKISPKKRRQSLNHIPFSMSRKSCTKRPPESPTIVRCLRLARMRVFGASGMFPFPILALFEHETILLTAWPFLARHLLWIHRIRPIPLPLPRPIPPVLKTPQKSSPKCSPWLNNLPASPSHEFRGVWLPGSPGINQGQLIPLFSSSCLAPVRFPPSLS